MATVPADGTVRYCTTEDGVQIAYKVEGAGPVVIMPPFNVLSFSLNHLAPAYDDFVRRLGEGRTVVQYDQRGTGLSRRDVEEFSEETQRRDLEAVVEAAGLDKVSFWGMQFGALNAIDYAVQHADKVESLVLYASFAKLAPDAESRQGLVAFAGLARANWEAASRAMADIEIRRRDDEIGLRVASWWQQSCSGETFARLAEAFLDFDATPLLSQVACPTLVLHRRDDGRYAEGQQVAAGIPGARFVPLPEGAIIINDNTPVLEAIDAFLPKVSVAATPVVQPQRAIDTTPGIRYARTSDGVNIAYCVEGQGYPMVLGVGWINPMELTWQHGPSWNSFAEYSRHFALVRFDRRGIGLSDRHITDFSVEARVRDLEAVVDALQLDRFALYGASEAGPMAMLYAARHPDRVSHLVVHGSYARGARLSDAKALEAVVSLVREQWSMGSAAITEAFLGPDADAREREWFTKLQREGANRHDAAGIMEAIPSIDVGAILRDIRVPTLIVHGTKDTIRPIENAKELAALISNARLVTYPGGHFLGETPADAAVKREVIEFISRRKLPEGSFFSAATAPPPERGPPPALAPEKVVDLDRPRVRYARTKDGVNIAYCAVGSGPALVVMNTIPFNHFVHGWDGIRPVASIVAQRGRTYVTFDSRGLGSSSAAEDLSLDAYVSDLEAVADTLDLREFTLQATTFSCPIAIAYAAKHPDRVSRMALEMPFVRGEEALESEVGRAVRALRGQNWEMYTETSMYLITNRNKEEAEGSAALLRAAATPETAKRTYDAVDAFDVSDRMPSVRCPTLVTFRMNRSFIPIEESQRVAAGIRGAEFLAVPDDQQWILQTGGFLGILEPSEVQSGQLPDAQPATAAATGAPLSAVQPQRAIDLTPGIRYATSADGTRIAYMTMGSGRPLIFALAYPSSIELDWELPEVRAFFEGLLPGRMIVRYDMRATASSQRDVQDRSAEAQANDLLAVADALRLDNFDIFASRGRPAHAGIIVSARNPSRVGRLVLWEPEPVTKPKHVDASTEAWEVLVRENWRAMTRTIADGIAPSASVEVKRFITRLLRETISPELFLRYEPSDARAELPNVQVPTLVLHARDDANFPIDESREVVAAIPDARLVTIEGNSRYFFLYYEQIVTVMREFLGDEPLAPAQPRAPSGVHTILFTDIVSSTALTQRLGDAKMQELVRAHDNIVRDALRANAGHEIKHTGDGIMASFGTASAALECALAIGCGIAARNEPNLQVHVGLNAGEPVAESAPDGRDDLYGASVQLARRLCDHSEAGQIVVADVVRQLALGKGFSFAPLPEAKLKGFDEPVRAYELVWKPDIPSGPDGLTAREVEVLRLIAAGRTNTEIAAGLTLSVRTVARHITNIYTKIGARNKAEATDYVHRNGLT